MDPEAGRQLVVGMISAPALPLFPSPQVVMCAPTLPLPPLQVVMCVHRLGMICAASGDHRSALKLLAVSKERYGKESTTHALAKEAELGLALAR